MNPIHIVLNVTTNDGQEENVNNILGPLMQSVAGENGTLDYRGFANGPNVVMLETYESNDAFLTHAANPEVQNFIAQFPTLFTVNQVWVCGEVNAEVQAALAPFNPTYFTPSGGVSHLFPQTVTT